MKPLCNRYTPQVIVLKHYTTHKILRSKLGKSFLVCAWALYHVEDWDCVFCISGVLKCRYFENYNFIFVPHFYISFVTHFLQPLNIVLSNKTLLKYAKNCIKECYDFKHHFHWVSSAKDTFLNINKIV